MNFRINLPQALADHWDVTVIDGKLRVRKKPPKPNQFDPERLAFIQSLRDEGWSLIPDARDIPLAQCEIFLHPDHDYVWRVSRLFNPRHDGWLAFTKWIHAETEAGRGSPFLPRIWDLYESPNGKWYRAKIERLQPISEIAEPDKSRLVAQREQFKLLFSGGEFWAYPDAELTKLMRRLLLLGGSGQWSYYCNADRDFMVRRGDKPQLVKIGLLCHRFS